jgi:hypothetical protein
MSEIPFHLTRRGRTFYEHTLPELVRQLTRLNERLDGFEARMAAADDSDDADWPTDDPEAL